MKEKKPVKLILCAWNKNISKKKKSLNVLKCSNDQMLKRF